MSLASAWGAQGAEGGNGGGGVVKNGNYMTFYSAGLYVQPTVGSAPAKIPGLDALTSYVQKLSILGYASKSTLLSAITPTPDRQYFVADPEQLTAEVKKRLLAEFQRVTNVDPSQLTLYALTDTESKTTFILPDFFKLNANDQVSILFHEAYWILHPKSSYNDVVNAEMAFEAALMSPSNLARVFDFVRWVGNGSEIYDAEVKWDLASGSLEGLTKKDKYGVYIPFAKIFNQELISCINSVMTSENSYTRIHFNGGFELGEDCYPFLTVSTSALAAQYPKSSVLAEMARSAGKAQAELVDNYAIDIVQSYGSSSLLDGVDEKSRMDYIVKNCGYYIQPNAAAYSRSWNVECDFSSDGKVVPTFGSF
jgi:hypothetical protein